MTTLTRALDYPFKFSKLGARLTSFIIFSLCAWLAVSAYVRAWNHTKRIAAKDEKAEAIASIDSTHNFGRVILNKDGTIVSWNHGMTDITGWTSRDMVGKSLARLTEGNAANRELLNRLLSPKAFGGDTFDNVPLRRAGKHPDATVLVRVQVRETNPEGGPWRFVTVDPAASVEAHKAN